MAILRHAKGRPPYLRTQAFACTPHSGAKSVAVDASKPLLRIARKANPNKGAGVPNGSTSTTSKRLSGEDIATQNAVNVSVENLNFAFQTVEKPHCALPTTYA